MSVQMSSGREIRLTDDPESDYWVAKDIETGVASQGKLASRRLKTLMRRTRGITGPDGSQPKQNSKS